VTNGIFFAKQLLAVRASPLFRSPKLNNNKMKQSAIQNLIKELEQFSKFPMVDKATIEAAIDFAKLRIETEREQIVEAYYAGTAQFDNASPIVSPKTPQDYYVETYGGLS
jgi:hypothetical protein